MPALLRAVWSYRGFILGSVQREFQARYRSSLLGALWAILNPLAMIAVYTLVFSQLMQARLPEVRGEYAYSIYLCAGVFAWGLFAEITGRAQTMFLDNANLLKKLSFPRICLPLVVTLNALTNFAIIFILFLLFLLFSGQFPGLVVLAALPLLLLQTAFALALGLILGVLNVFFRDVGQLFGILLQFWFWLTPIVYPASIIPEAVRPLLALNPLIPLIQAWQGVFVQGVWPVWSSLLPLLGLSLLLAILGLRLFRQRAGDLVDEL
ncbi:MAG: ABC transporter permease [Sterolibacterium sp.]|nr:ABC transporter permease [Sterolibacterium sp.]